MDQCRTISNHIISDVSHVHTVVLIFKYAQLHEYNMKFFRMCSLATESPFSYVRLQGTHGGGRYITTNVPIPFLCVLSTKTGMWFLRRFKAGEGSRSILAVRFLGGVTT